MTGTVVQAEQSTRRCAHCGYDLRGLGVSRTPTCPECGAVAGSWRSAYPVPWLVPPALRLMIWGLPALVAALCIGRYINVARGVAQHRGLFLGSDAVLLYALPLAAVLVGAGLLAAASPGTKGARAWSVGLVALVLACVGAMVADHTHLTEYSAGFSAGTVSYLATWSAGSIAGRAAVVGAGAVAVLCLALLGRLVGELGVDWFAIWRSRLTFITGLVLLGAGVLREIMQTVVIAHSQGKSLGGGPIPGTPHSWMDAVFLGLCTTAVALIWSLAFAASIKVRADDAVAMS